MKPVRRKLGGVWRRVVGLMREQKQWLLSISEGTVSSNSGKFQVRKLTSMWPLLWKKGIRGGYRWSLSEMRMPEFARSTYMGVLLACISASHACSATDKGQRAGQSLWNWDYRCDLPWGCELNLGSLEKQLSLLELYNKMWMIKLSGKKIPERK